MVAGILNALHLIGVIGKNSRLRDKLETSNSFKEEDGKG
jgi:hypothetical protein